MQEPALAHYRPWIEDVRKEKPYQLEDRIEQLFHEKSVTGYGAFNRLFDETDGVAALQGGGQDARDRADAQPAAGSRARAKRKAAADALARTFRDNLRLFTLITNTLAKDKEISDRWRGFPDVAAARHLSNRVEPEVVDALVARRACGLSAPVAPLLRAESEVVRQEAAAALGPQRAAAEGAEPHHLVERGAGDGARRPTARSRRAWRRSPSASSATAGSMRRCGPARRRARSRTRPCRRRTPTCCSTIRASRAT